MSTDHNKPIHDIFPTVARQIETELKSGKAVMSCWTKRDGKWVRVVQKGKIVGGKFEPSGPPEVIERKN